MNPYDKSHTAIVSEKGQVTIPKRLRDRLGLVPGSVLAFDDQDGALVMRKHLAENPFEAAAARFASPRGSMSTR